jgi:hypothetical protein
VQSNYQSLSGGPRADACVHPRPPPQILVTTSRDPSSRLIQFAKEMRLVVPNSQRVNRWGGWVSGSGGWG